MAVIRRPVRSRPIRLFLISMFAVPLLCLIGLWAFAASITVPAAISDHNYNVSSVAITSPDVATLTVQLPAEQQETYIWLLSGRQAPKSSLLATRQAITKALPGAEAALLVGDNLLSASSKADLNVLEADLRRIPAIRQSVDAGTMTAAAAFQAYSDIIDAQFQSYYASTLDRGASMQAIAVGATDSALALEMASREVTLVAGAQTIDRGRLDAGARELFVSSAANRQFLMGQALSLLTPSLRADYVTLVNSAPYRQFEAMESQITAGPGSAPVPVDAKTWSTDTGIVLGAMLKAQTANGTRLSALSASASNGLFTEAVLAGSLGLLAVLLSVFLPVWFGRKITADLGKLHTSVRGMAEERLPRVVDRLRRGEDVDVLAESPAPARGSIREISQVAESFGIVQEAAVQAAVEQARLRKGVNQVFLNISMRNQSLLHRQLGMLDSMERGTSDPAALADLFRLDHLTTRMRRHAEGLIILSGSTPGRGWREPVPVVDVLRAAVAEVEDYVRVDVLSESRDLVAGNAVNDVIHLVAELVENATVFSPPNTRIEVRADRAGTGLVAEIEDRGLGMTPEELADINRRLANPPEFDLANSEQLGLFVVSRLAARHAVKVSLRQSVYGGTTAILLLPFGVIVREEEAGSPGSHHEGSADAPLPGSVFPPPAAGGPGQSGPDQSGPGQSAPGQSAPGQSAPGQSGPDQAGTGPLPPSGPAGRHRLAATGRRAETGFTGRDEDGDRPAPRPLPRAPWEYAQSGPQAPEPAPPPAGQPPWEAASWPAAFGQPPAGQGQDQRAADPPATGPQAWRGQQADGATPGTHLGMPIRVPQASLVPQLRGGRAGQQAAESSAPAADERSPEATRNMMVLMQRGWERGRVDDLDAPTGTPDNETDR